jgi:hypothetical protein
MRTAILFGAALFGLGVADAGAAAAPAPSGAEESLNALIEGALRAEGPFFTPGERAVIERKCGYRPGEWDGYEASFGGGVFHCTNGRRVDDPEMKAVMSAAGPRIGRRVGRVMARSDVRAAIGRVASEAAARAMARLEPLPAGRRR